MERDPLSLLNEHRERLVCALAAAALALTVWAVAAHWRAAEELGPAKGLLPPQARLPQAPFLTDPFGQVWHSGGRDPFQASGPRLVQRGATELPFPPLPPVPVEGPPPAEPWPSLYRNGVVRSQAHLLALVATAAPPSLKSGKPCTIRPRPHDIVQAKGDPQPIEGSIRREDGGRIWFYFNKPRGMGHPRNPLAVADLLVLKRKTTTVQQAYAERSLEAGDDAGAHVALAQECIDGDLTAEAEAELRRATELDPKHIAAHLELADLHLARGNRDGEVAACEAALAAGADSPQVRLRLGRRCLEHNLLALAYQHFAAGFRAAARAPIGDVADRRLPVPKAPLAQQLLRRAAEARILDGRLDEADRLLQRLAAAAPDDPAVRNAQALSDLLAGRAGQALAALTQVAEAPDPPASALNNLGALLFAQGDIALALERFNACRAAAPGHTKATLNAVLAHAALDQPDPAEKLLAALGDRPARSVACHLVVGYVHERRGRLDEAAAAYRAALALDRADFLALCGLGRCQLAKGELEAATAPFATARLLRPGDPLALRGIGSCLYRAGKFAEAAEAFRQLADREGATPRDLARLGIASLRLADRRRDAAALFDRALAATRQAAPYALVGKAYVAYAGLAGPRDQAEALFRKAQTLAGVPQASQYAAQALRRIYVARREEFTTLAFQGEHTAKLPEGWAALGRGVPLPVIRDDALHLEGQPPAANLRQVVRGVALSTPAGGGFLRVFTRFEAQLAVPMTNLAPVGVSLGLGKDLRFQVAVRTTLKPQPSRRLAWRVVRGAQPAPWSDVAGPIAAESLKLGLALGDGTLDVLRDGRTVAAHLPFPELRRARDSIELGLFAAPDAGQQCLVTIREVELVWKKIPAER